MKVRHRIIGHFAVIATLTGALFAACAEGTDFEGTTTGVPGRDGGSGAGGIPKGEIGGPCEEQEDCVEGTCTQVGKDKICTHACPPDCPSGTYCAIIEGDAICVPDLDQQCLPCTGAVDCKSPSDQCLMAPLGDKFCAIDCSTQGICPNGFTCMAATEYASSGGMGSGSGGSGGGGNGSGGSGGSGGGEVPDAGKPSAPYKFCVPNSGFSCPCNDKRDGVKKTCIVESTAGKCVGSETCEGDSGKWIDCTAPMPTDEVCNGKDDNCNQGIDEGEGDALCADKGPPPPNSGWKCTAGACGIGPCDPGWAAYPPGGPVEAGCQCKVESGEPNNMCGSATNVGSVSDAGGTLTISGTLSSDEDVDVYVFDTLDTPEGSTNSYHVSIDLTAPAPNDEFLLDVIRGGPCTDAPGGGSAGITAYDWCVDGSFQGPNGLEGEAPCAPEGGVHCADHSTPYYVRVHRKPGSPKTCATYTVSVTAKGGDPCDFTLKCQ